MFHDGLQMISLAVTRIAGSNGDSFATTPFDLQRRQMTEQERSQASLAPPRGVLSLDPIALKWRKLADRRRAHLVDLYLTGRWKRYYSEEQFQATFRDTMAMAERWNEIAPKSKEEDQPAV